MLSTMLVSNSIEDQAKVIFSVLLATPVNAEGPIALAVAAEFNRKPLESFVLVEDLIPVV